MIRNKLEALKGTQFSKMKIGGLNSGNIEPNPMDPGPLFMSMGGSALGTKWSFDGDSSATYGGVGMDAHYSADYSGIFNIDGVIGKGTWTPWGGFHRS